jgi:hypothetical protein
MSRFDPKAYEDAVVKPLRRWSSRDLPDDLVTRYSVDLGMTDAQLVTRLAEVRALWNKNAISTGKAAAIRGIYKAFLTADADLKADAGTALGTIAWWRRADAKRAGARQGAVDTLAEALRANFGALGLVAAGQLDATMRAMSAALAPDEVEKALVAAQVRREVPLDLPTSSGLQDTVYRSLCERLTDARLLSVVELLHGQTPGFCVLRAFDSTPPRPGGLTPVAVDTAVDRANRRSGNQPEREALGILVSAVRTGVDLRELTVFHLLHGIRESHAQGVPESALLSQLLKTGMDRSEASLAVFSVLNEGSRVKQGGLAEVAALLGEGKLAEARLKLAAISSTEDAAAATALVERQAEQVMALRTAAREALRTGDEGTALHRLREATSLSVDDEDLVAELRRIPLSPVLDVSVAPEGMGVRVSWRAPADHPDNALYRLVRRLDRVPADPEDGTAVREGGADAVIDPQAPAGAAVGYAVFARVPDGVWSRPVGRTAISLPPVQDVRINHDGDVISAHWQLHPDAASVEVTRQTDDQIVPVPLSGKTAFREQVPGDEHAYSFVVRYGAGGSSQALRVRTSSLARLAPVQALRIGAVAGGEGPRVAITWRKPAFGDVTIRRATKSAPWDYGAEIPASALAGHGTEVRGAITDEGEWRTLTADVPAGLFRYTAFTHGPAGVVRGHEEALGSAQPVTGLSARRLGDEQLLSWVWPEQAGTAEVTWSGGRKQITRQQYQREGGCRVRCAGGSISVSAVVSTADGECRSSPADVVIDVPAPAIHYSVELSRRVLLGGGQVRVRLVADEQISRCTIVLVVAPGRVMPLRPDQGQELLRQTHDFAAATPVELVADLPKLRKPFWVRCFLPDSGPVQLVDPPTTQLKVS